ncbi:MAG: DUF1080 domain-containing protein, partial [Proteobacteria bacterium]|nr:DUF1080 domain-containing protein [Pseudomonadota bacterium]
QWNDYRIVAIGERIDVYVNGALFSQLWDQQIDQKDLSGSLALQLHSGPETRIAFRNITLETLTDQDSGRLAKFDLPDESPSIQAEQEGFVPQRTDNKPLNLGFELGTLEGWTALGNAFDQQPVKHDGISKRWPGQNSNKQGDFFIGGFEIVQDLGTGTLESQTFKATHPFAGFLFGGGQDSSTRAELVLHDASGTETKVIARAARPISARPRTAATRGESPRLRNWKMFSSTTMLSSTRMPTVSVSARVVRKLNVNPCKYMNAKVAMSEVGIAKRTISVLLHE